MTMGSRHTDERNVYRKVENRGKTGVYFGRDLNDYIPIPEQEKFIRNE